MSKQPTSRGPIFKEPLKNPPFEAYTAITFKLKHYNETTKDHLLFYQNRNLEEDFKQIFKLISEDSLFISHERFLEINPEQPECKIYIEDWFVSTEEETPNPTDLYLSNILKAKLSHFGLSRYFSIKGFSRTKTTSDNSLTFKASYNKGALANILPGSENELKLKSMNFPIQELPQEFLCPITSGMIDVPCQDKRFPDTTYDYETLTAAMFKYFKNPTTNMELFPEHLEYNYILWDEIQTFIEKIQFLNQKKIPYKNHMQKIKTKSISLHELKFFIPKHEDKDTQPPYTIALNELKKKRLINAIFYFKKAFLTTSESEKNKLDAKCYYVLLCFKTNRKENLSFAIEMLSDIKQNKNDCNQPLLASLLTYASLYYLNSAEYKGNTLDEEKLHSAKILAEEAQVIFENSHSENIVGVNIEDVTQLLRKLQLLIYFKVKDTFNEHCKALRKAVMSKSEQKLADCKSFLLADPNIPDTNPKTGYTAMYLAIKKGKLRQAWYLKTMYHKINFDLKTKEDKSSRDLIQGSPNKNFQKLLSFYLVFRISILSDTLIKKEDLNKLKGLIGLTNDVGLIYLNRTESFVLTNFCLPGVLCADFFGYAASKLKNDPDLSNKWEFKDILQLAEFSNLSQYPSQSIAILLNFTPHTKNISQISLFSQQKDNMERLIPNSILNILFEKKLINKNELESVAMNFETLSYGKYQLTFECNISPSLFQYLTDYLTRALKNKFESIGTLTCESIRTANVTAPSEEISRNLVTQKQYNFNDPY